MPAFRRTDGQFLDGIDEMLDCDWVGEGSRKPNNRGYFNSPATVWGEILKDRNLSVSKTLGRGEVNRFLQEKVMSRFLSP
jgi:hypothetical protein